MCQWRVRAAEEMKDFPMDVYSRVYGPDVPVIVKEVKRIYSCFEINLSIYRYIANEDTLVFKCCGHRRAEDGPNGPRTLPCDFWLKFWLDRDPSTNEFFAATVIDINRCHCFLPPNLM